MAIYLDERVDEDSEGHIVLTGRVHGEWDLGSDLVAVGEMAFSDALEWGSERDGRIAIDTYRGRFSAGPVPFDPFPQLPDDHRMELLSGQRRPPGDEWLDEDPPGEVAWELTVSLEPDSLDRDDRPAQVAVVERVVARLTAAGLSDVEWSADSLDAGLEEIERQHRAAGSPDEFNWFGIGHSLAFAVRARGKATSHRDLRERARRVIVSEVATATGRDPYGDGAEDLVERWGVTDIDVHPPGYQRPDISPSV